MEVPTTVMELYKKLKELGYKDFSLDITISSWDERIIFKIFHDGEIFSYYSVKDFINRNIDTDITI